MSTREQANFVASEKMTQMDSNLNQIKVNSMNGLSQPL